MILAFATEFWILRVFHVFILYFKIAAKLGAI